MNHSVKRLRQTTLFESFGGSGKRGKILDLMETNVETKPELREILAAAAEKRLSRNMNQKKSVDIPGSVDCESCSTMKTVDSSLDDFSLTLSQDSEDLFPEMYCSSGATSSNCCDTKSTSSRNRVSEMQLRRLPECCPSLPPLKPSEAHTVMFKLPIQSGICPDPSPCDYCDTWDPYHVRLPCSPENKCPVLQNGEKSIESRWELIERSLLQDITSSYDLQEAILQYNSQYANRWDFRGLHAFFKDSLKPEEKEKFFEHTLPGMIRLTLQLPQICTQPIPLLKQKSNHAVTLTQKQIACLLSNAFFCTFPRRNTPHKRNEQRNEPKTNNEYENYPDINFNRLYSGGPKRNTLCIPARKAEKLKCLLNYFARVTSQEPKGTVTFHHQSIRDVPAWASSEKKIQAAVMNSDGVIEVEGSGMLQVDFANKFVGGGVLGLGSVQEEIRFVICPELIISRLFTECLGICDALIITGVEQFNNHSGYADSFTWDGDFCDNTPRDSWGRRYTKIVAMDAIHYRNPMTQYRVNFMQRELNKAFCAFYDFDVPAKYLPAVATGNWGCGVYKGNPHLKFLLQLMAASEVGREMLYFTFKNPQLAKELENMYHLISSNDIRVGDVWALLCDYSSAVLGTLKTNPPGFYDFFCNAFSAASKCHGSSQESVSLSSVSVSSGSTESAGTNSGSTEELTDIEPSSQNEPG